MSEDEKILRERKWKKLLKYRPLFNFVPFLDFALVAGSMAYGEISENSDFDFILGAKTGRIFTTRFFCFLIFGLAGVRRAKHDAGESLKDKVCFNHFVTRESYKFIHAPNLYSQNLYENLIPFFGSREKINEFFKTNSALIKNPNHSWEKWQKNRFNFFRFIVENLLSWHLGNFSEKILKIIQVRRIKNNFKKHGAGSMPRLCYNDRELEFHPDISREKISSVDKPLTQ